MGPHETGLRGISTVAISAERFLESAAAHGLLGADEAAALAAALPPEKRSQDADELARQLVRDGKLTRFQAAAVYQEKADGLVLGNYVILDRLGAGGMGQVYRARHRRMDRVVALKVLSKKLLGSPEALERFHRETKAAARLSHPNIVTAHDADEAAGMHFLVMEYIEGSDLAALVKKEGPRTPAQAIDLILQAAQGLEHAHAQGIVHRDIKPPNLLVDLHGTVKILDMGLARFHDPLASPEAAGKDLTHSGSIMGTIDYMAPEQAMDSRHANAQSDLYSLGCTLFFLLTGRPPFAGDTVLKRLTAHQQAAIPLLSAARPDVSPTLDAICQKLLAKRPAGRYSSASELIAALESCLSTQPAAAPQLAAAPRQSAAPLAPVPVAVPISSPAAANSSLGEMTSIILPGDSGRRRAAKARGGRKLAAAGLLFLLAATGAFWYLSRGNGEAAPQVAEAAEPPMTNLAAATAQTKTDPDASGAVLHREEQPPAPTMPVRPAAAPASSASDPPPDAPPVAMPAALPAATPSGGQTPADSKLTSAAPAALSPEPAAPAIPAAADPGAAASPPLAAADSRLPVPGQAQQEQSRQLLKDVFKEDFAHARQPEAKQALAEKLLKQAEATQSDPAANYVTLHAAIDLAIEAADPALAGRAIGALALRFRVNPFEETAEAIDRMLTKPHSPETNKLIALAAIQHINEAVADEKYDAGKRLADFAVAAARKAKDSVLLKQAVEKGKAVTAARLLWDAKEKGLAVLEARPDDPAANLSVGNYLCFARSDWPAGLPHLAKGSDAVLRDLAAQSLDAEADPAARAALADKWWSAAEKARPKAKAELRAGAAYWYAQAEPGLSGLAQTKVQKRLADLGAGATSHAPRTSGKPPADTLDLPLGAGVALRVRLIPAGKFVMGSPPAEPDRNAGEHQHPVAISHPFYLGVTEVTQGQWQAVMGTTPSHFAGDPLRPVEQVSWDDCQKFIERLNNSPLGRARRFRLPSEAEWEYACRAGSGTAYYFGGDARALPGCGWFKDASEQTTHPVGELRPNAWGLFDMAGNVWEWCNDWYVADYYLSSPAVDPPGPLTGSRRSLRGGSWANLGANCRSAERNLMPPATTGSAYGLRIACDTGADAAAGKLAAGPGSGPTNGTAAAVPGGLSFEQARRERQVAEWVLSAGGRIKVLTASSTGPDLPEIADAAGLPNEPLLVKSIDLSSRKDVGDADMPRLEKLAALDDLRLLGTSVGDAGLASLKGLTTLQVLYLHNTPITDAGLAHLAGLHRMLRIHFSGDPKITDAGLRILEGMSDLHNLSLSDTHATDVTLRRLAALKQLRWLSISRCPMTDAGMRALESHPLLVTLEIVDSPIGDAGMAHLTNMPMLSNLNLQSSQVTDGCIEAISRIPHLSSVNLRSTKVTDAGIRRLQLARPQCRIER
jgi:serine/threonine protein kinase/formylglycine-generating enzyme required for sulfatase activity